MVIAFTVNGVPVPQGSKMPWGAEANPHIKAWRATVADAAAGKLDEPFDGPVAVQVSFIFPRPKSHFRTGRNSNLLRESAPHWHAHTPDLDKLQRAIGDAIKGVIVRDDSQVASWRVHKAYGPRPHAHITVAELK